MWRAIHGIASTTPTPRMPSWVRVTPMLLSMFEPIVQVSTKQSVQSSSDFTSCSLADRLHSTGARERLLLQAAVSGGIATPHGRRVDCSNRPPLKPTSNAFQFVHFGLLRLPGRELSDTLNVKAFWRVAPSVRLSLRAIWAAGVFCRASVLSSRTSCAVHSRLLDFLTTMTSGVALTRLAPILQTETGTCRSCQAAFTTDLIPFVAASGLLWPILARLTASTGATKVVNGRLRSFRR